MSGLEVVASVAAVVGIVASPFFQTFFDSFKNHLIKRFSMAQIMELQKNDSSSNEPQPPLPISPSEQKELKNEDPFPSLVEMELKNVSLSFKKSQAHGRMFPKLQLMDLSNCEKLEGLTMPSSLEILCIEECGVELPAFLKGLSSLSTLKIRNQDRFTTFDKEFMDGLSSLKELDIRNCKNFRSLPEGGFPGSLVKLDVVRCSRELYAKLEDRKSPEWSMIRHIPGIIRRF